MDQKTLATLIKIVDLNSENNNLKILGYNSEIGLYDPNIVKYDFPVSITSEFFVDDKYFSVYMNAELDKFLLIRITKKEYERLGLL